MFQEEQRLVVEKDETVIPLPAGMVFGRPAISPDAAELVSGKALAAGFGRRFTLPAASALRLTFVSFRTDNRPRIYDSGNST